MTVIINKLVCASLCVNVQEIKMSRFIFHKICVNASEPMTHWPVNFWHSVSWEKINTIHFVFLWLIWSFVSFDEGRGRHWGRITDRNSKSYYHFQQCRLHTWSAYRLKRRKIQPVRERWFLTLQVAITFVFLGQIHVNGWWRVLHWTCNTAMSYLLTTLVSWRNVYFDRARPDLHDALLDAL